LHWRHRGYDNSVELCRRELRRMAESKVQAIEQKAITEIELSCLEAQTRLALAGLTSEGARGFLERLPGIEGLMPKLSFAGISGEADPPTAEPPVNRNALRQPRTRDAQGLP